MIKAGRELLILKRVSASRPSDDFDVLTTAKLSAASSR
jgi:hypothetical protein